MNIFEKLATIQKEFGEFEVTTMKSPNWEKPTLSFRRKKGANEKRIKEIMGVNEVIEYDLGDEETTYYAFVINN